MLSIYTLKSATEASKYYQQGDYYTREGADKNTLWLGCGAEKLGLNGSVDFKVFRELLEGRLPNGLLMSQVERGGYHRPGYDLTFSAPKSVSILALVADNQDILKAHRESIQEVISKIEQKYGSTRVKDKSVVSIEKTENIVVASFEHGDSRAGDPNLHTHCVLMNMTENSFGIWRTLFADEIYTDKLLNGLEYRSLLAQKLMKLGYEIKVGEKGTFEIIGVPTNLISYFSKRREEITSWLKENNMLGGLAAKTANFYTRSHKMNADPDERKERWINETVAAGSSIKELNEIRSRAEERGPIELPDPYLTAQNSVDYAISHLLERQSLFSIKKIIKTAKLMSLLPSVEGDFLKVIEEKIQNKELFYGEDKLLTSPIVKEYENNIIQSMQEGKNKVDRIMGNLVSKIISHYKFKINTEREALRFLLANKDSQVLVTAISEPQLNDIIKTFSKVCEGQQYYPRILCQKAQNVDLLKKRINSEKVGTIAGFLLACELRSEAEKKKIGFLAKIEHRFKAREAKEVWIVHQDISLKQIDRLQHWANVFGARIVFTQTEKQLIPGLFFLRENGIGTFKVNGTHLHKSEKHIKEELLNQIKRLEETGAIQGFNDYDERLKRAAELYSDKHLTSTIVTLTNKERALLNENVRTNLKAQKILSGSDSEAMFTQLKPLWLTNTEKVQLHLYQPGDILRFEQSEPGFSIQKGDYLTINNIDLNAGTILLRKNDATIVWDPKMSQVIKKVEVFRQEKKEIMVGDRLIWTRSIKHINDTTLDRVKNEKAIVTAIKDSKISIRHENGKTDLINMNETSQQHWDYGYAVLLKDFKLGFNQETIAVIQAKNLNNKTIQNISKVLVLNEENKVATTLICEDGGKLKETIDKVAFQSIAFANRDSPYKRAEALKDDQDIPTQQIFHRLQAEYLKIKQFNPEFLIVDEKYDINESKLTPSLRFACDLVDKLCLKYAERDSFFDLKEVTKEAILLSEFQVQVETIEDAFQIAIKKGWLKVVSEPGAEEVLVACRHTVLMEKLSIQKMKEGKDKLNPIFEKDSLVIKEIQNKASNQLTLGQKEAVTLILTTKDRFVAVQGIAGSGKTTALREISKHYSSIGVKPLVLANTAAAKNQAQNASGIEAMTTAQFLTRVETLLSLDKEKANKLYGQSRLIILDEASLVATKEIYRLQTAVQKLDTRLCLVGDFKQLGSIGAGMSFQTMLAYGIDKAVMLQNVRLNEENAFKALKEAYAENIKGSLHTLRDSIEEIPNKTEALERLVTIYMSLNEMDRKETIIITPLNESRRFVNQSIREQLKKTDELQGSAIAYPVLLPKDIHEVDKKEISAYKIGELIRFNTQNERLGIKSQDYAKIIEVDNNHHRVSLLGEEGNHFFWSPKDLKKPSDIEIFYLDNRELMKNDMIIFRRNNEHLGVSNGDKATVTKVEDQTIEVQLLNGKSLVLDLTKKENQHLDYGYALTVFAAQGRDVKRVLAYGEGPNSYIRNFSELKKGDTISLPKELQKHDGLYHENTKLVKVTKIKDQQLTLKDRYGGIHKVTADKSSLWEYYPPFHQRKEHELPLSTSQQSFIVQITRGDWLHLIVPNIDDFQKTLEKHDQIKKSALNRLDPNWERLNLGVQRLVNNITGRAEDKNFYKNTSSLKSKVQYKPNTKASQKEESQNYINKDEIRARLESDILGYACQWLGPPKKIRSNEARWKGALTVITRGAKAGIWRSWSSGEGGRDLISLYQFAHGITWKEAIKELSHNLGISLNVRSTLKLNELSLRKNKQEIEAQYEIIKKINRAKKEYSRGSPIQGTLAETYLRDHRGIKGELPNDFKFRTAMRHPHTRELVPTLLAPIRDKDNNISGIVRIFLNKDGSKYNKIYMENGKEEKAVVRANLGIVGEGAVVVQRGSFPTTLWIAEGIETALSVAQAVPNQTIFASLSASNFKNILVGPEVEKIVICADKDMANSNTSNAVITAVENHLAKGKRVFVVLPESIVKCDFNDFLKQEGVERIKATIDKMTEVKDVSLLRNNGLEDGLAIQRIKIEPELNGGNFSKKIRLNEIDL